jgi:pyruvate,orthophosphate dikinase
VPPAFVLGTEVCRDYLRRGDAALAGLAEILDRELQQLAERTGRVFGDAKRPLLVSVRSGAALSMPGMMETVLNVGLNDTTLRALIRMTGNPRLGHDCRCRLVQQYGEVVHAIARRGLTSGANPCSRHSGRLT